MASREIDLRSLEFDPEDFIAFAAPFLRHGWKLAAGKNTFWDSHYQQSRYTHEVLLYRIRTDDGLAEYRSLDDYGNTDPLPKKICITNSEQRSMYYDFSHGYWFAHFATVFPNVKPTKSEQKRYGIDATGHGETWNEDNIDEEAAKAILKSTPRQVLDDCKSKNILSFPNKDII